MMIRRTNLNDVTARGAELASSTAEAFPKGMLPKASRQPRHAANGPSGPAEPPARPPAGDIIYGAKAIARQIFGDDGNRARRRVFSLWNHYRDRKERAGFFKLKGALCLSITQWKAFHGLD